MEGLIYFGPEPEPLLCPILNHPSSIYQPLHRMKPLTPVATKLDHADIWQFMWIDSADSSCPTQLPDRGKGALDSDGGYDNTFSCFL